MVATSAEWGAVIRTRREDVSEDLAFVRIRGTKRKTRDRIVPIVTKDQRTLLEAEAWTYTLRPDLEV